MKGFVVSAALVAMALTAGTALAADPPRNGAKAQARAEKLFPKIDRNGDGIIKIDEWVAHGYKYETFAVVDTDKNGQITIKELIVAQAFCDRCFR